MINLIRMRKNRLKEIVRASQKPLTPEEKENVRNYNERQKYIKLKPELWPDFDLLWDYNLESQRYAIDGCTKETFYEQFPEGLQLGNVSLQELKDALKSNYEVKKDKIWGLGKDQKLAKAILHWKEKRTMTPIFIGFTKDTLTIRGGYHRYSVCVIKNPEVIPILIESSGKEKLEKILSVVWNPLK